MNPARTPRGTLPIRPWRGVTVRLARTHEWLTWDRLMNKPHYLGFKQFAGRGLRYVAEWRGQWVALAGWQTGVFQGKVRDPWLGWSKELQFQRLHLIGNNTRFLILPVAQGCQNLGSSSLGANLQRLSGTGRRSGAIPWNGPRVSWTPAGSRARCPRRRTGWRWAGAGVMHARTASTRTR